MCTHTTACDLKALGGVPSEGGADSIRIPNGVINYTDLAPGSVAELECDPGYRPKSSINRTCGSDGHWSEEVLSCVVIIQPPGTYAE